MNEGGSRRTFLGTVMAGALSTATPREADALSNDILQVTFYPDRPVVRHYRHRPSGMQFEAGSDRGLLVINSRAVPWREWGIRSERPSAERVRYSLRLSQPDIELQFRYRLRGYVLEFEAESKHDPGRALRSLAWRDLPLLACSDPDLTVWREVWKQRDWSADIGRGLWSSRLSEQPLGACAGETEPGPAVYACFYKPDRVCCTVLSNMRYLPLRNQVKEVAGGRRYELSVAPYQPYARDKRLEPLRAQVAFLPDLNGDGRADASDFQLWVNRQLPDPDPKHRTAIWYKIFCASPNERGKPRATFREAGEIIERVHRYTDGLPQIVYLVGWQYQGHDSGYPSIDRINTDLGSRDDLVRLRNAARERFNAVVSYHINLDDSYKSHPGWDKTVIARGPGGSLMRWEEFNGERSYHISHTKDVESGKVFKRLEAMMREVPVDTAIHLDAFRNMNWSWELDRLIGPVEELECGVKPIVQFFRSRGIDVTTESVDADGAEWCGIVSGVYHIADPANMVQLRHGKLLGGGRPGKRGLWRWGMGSGRDEDVSYWYDGKDYVRAGVWNDLLDDIYLGTLLYHFYLEREMTVLHVDEQAAHLRFADGVTAVVPKQGSGLLVQQGYVTVAHDYDRFIPRSGAIYAYSRDGCSRAWLLPAGFRNRKLEIRTLGDSTGEPVRRGVGDALRLDLLPRTPVKIIVAV